MLSIGAMGSGQGSYYVGLAREDYYLNGGEPPGRWIGQGAERLGFTTSKVGGDVVEKATFLAAFEGFQVDGGQLVQNAGSERRQPGWDLTFSAPKSVSLVWALADPEVHKAISEAHFESVKAALSLVEDRATTRRGKGGAIHEKADLVIATFEHGTSRAQDPQLHTHALVLNLAVRADGTTGALESKAFYESKMAVGALYRAELSGRLQELGYQIEPSEEAFEITGVPQSLIKEMSKRRAEIETALENRGDEGARAAAFAALDTRTVKEHIAREILVEQWREVAEGHDFGPEAVRSLRSPAPQQEAKPSQQGAIPDLFQESARQGKPSAETLPHVFDDALRQLVEIGLDRVMAHNSHFGELDLVAAVAHESARMPFESGMRFSTEDIRQIVSERLKEARDLGSSNTGSGKIEHQIVPVGEAAGTGRRRREQEERYSTREMLNIEKKLMADIKPMSKGGHGFYVGEFTLQKAMLTIEASETLKAIKNAANPLSFGNKRILTKEQRAALEHITQREGTISVVSGMAGTGKTFMLNAAREAWEGSGLKVIGASVSGKATRGLKDGAGIDSRTLASLLWEPEQMSLYALKHHAKQLIRAAQGRTTYKLEGVQLDSKTVVVIDEAGMVGTKDMAQLVEKVRSAGAKLVLVGDSRQLQPVSAGGPFKAIEELVGAATLTEITRQKLDKNDHNPAWRREAVKAFAEQRAGDGLQAYKDRGFFTIRSQKEDAMKDLVKAWREKVTGKKAEEWPAKAKASVMKETLIFANTRIEVGMLNEMVQDERARNGELGFRSVKIQDQTIREKDRVIITQTDRTLNVDNGDLGVVKRLELITGKMLVKLDDGREVSLPYRHFDQVQLGYAITTHKGQGATVDNAFVLCGGAWTDREKAYVQASRARLETRFFTDSHKVSSDMSESNQKEIAYKLMYER